jgi:hypothetical protein
MGFLCGVWDFVLLQGVVQLTDTHALTKPTRGQLARK